MSVDDARGYLDVALDCHIAHMCAEDAAVLEDQLRDRYRRLRREATR